MLKSFREDYDKLSQFVSDKKLRVKTKVKVPDRSLSYNEDGSSDSDHDAYLQRVKAEGEDRDSEDGMICLHFICQHNTCWCNLCSLLIIRSSVALLSDLHGTYLPVRLLHLTFVP